MTIPNSQEVDSARLLQLKERHAQLMQPYVFHTNAVDIWGMEVLKNLFLLGAAGVAGVCTLAQVGQVGGRPVAPSDLPFLHFAIATITAVLALLAGRFMHEVQSDAWFKTVNKFARTSDMTIDGPEESCRTQFLHILTFALGIVSAGSSLLAGWSLYTTFF